jgi:hypothetical protein
VKYSAYRDDWLIISHMRLKIPSVWNTWSIRSATSGNGLRNAAS